MNDDRSKAGQCPVDDNARKLWTQQQDSSSNLMPTNLSQKPLPNQRQNLSTEREVSSIPKSDDDRLQGDKWIYPSQQMFFDAMRRKSWNPKEQDMSAVVPIHNAVNERAWYEILQWEQGKGSEKCVYWN